MNYETILADQTDGVGIITLNRPEVLNAMSLNLIKELDTEVSRMGSDDRVKAIIITGSGGKAFSAGADIHEMRTLTPAQLSEGHQIRYDSHWSIANCRKPIIGAINGLCYGGGTVLASSLDFLIGCEKSNFRFLAVVYGQMNATWTLPVIIGWPMAKEILYTGRIISPEEAYRIGLLNHLVPSSDLLEKATDLASNIANNHPPSVETVKRLMLTNLDKSWEEMHLREHTARQGQNLPLEQGFKEFIDRKGR